MEKERRLVKGRKGGSLPATDSDVENDNEQNHQRADRPGSTSMLRRTEESSGGCQQMFEGLADAFDSQAKSTNNEK